MARTAKQQAASRANLAKARKKSGAKNTTFTVTPRKKLAHFNLSEKEIRLTNIMLGRTVEPQAHTRAKPRKPNVSKAVPPSQR